MEMISLFKAQPAQIKVRIEDLIMKQYMRRDDKDRTKYWYVAWIIKNYCNSINLDPPTLD